jgi:hypothetical protein
MAKTTLQISKAQDPSCATDSFIPSAAVVDLTVNQLSKEGYVIEALEFSNAMQRLLKDSSLTTLETRAHAIIRAAQQMVGERLVSAHAKVSGHGWHTIAHLDGETPSTTLWIKPFDVSANLASNQVCGNGTNGASFEFSVDLSVNELDPDGSVIQIEQFQQAVRTAFDPNGTMYKGSCEEVAHGVLFIAHREIGKRLISGSATVTNRTGSVTATWQAGEVAPVFLRKATEAEQKETLAQRAEAQRTGITYRSVC